MIQRLYDLSYLRDVWMAKRLFPAPEPVPAPAFPKPGQTIRLVHSPADVLPPPAFPKPSQINRGADKPRRFTRRCKTVPAKLAVVGADVAPAREATAPAVSLICYIAPQSGAWIETEEYLKALTDLAQNELARAAIKEDWNTVTRCFGATPDAALFARSYERYLADREAVGNDLGRVFRHCSWWLNLKRGGR